MLIVLFSVGTTQAGLTVTRSNGIAVTGADGISFINLNGIAVTGADGMLAMRPNGIATNGVDGIAVTGADGVTYLSPNGIAVTGADGLNIIRADGIAVTGADGIAVTGADGQTYHVNSLTLRRATGLSVTGADNTVLRGVTGVLTANPDGIAVTGADGIAVTGADGIAITGADGAVLTGLDGNIFSISPDGIAITGADGIAVAGADGIAVTGADTINNLTAEGIAATGADTTVLSGLQSLDPELATLLNALTDDSNVNAVIIYHRLPTAADIAALQSAGIRGGTRYRALPMISVTATKRQLVTISHFAAVRSIYGNRTLQPNSDPYLALNGASHVPADTDLTRANNYLPVTGRGVTVAVLDTGVDGTHADLAGCVVQNVKLFDAQSLALGFANPTVVENLPNTDQAYGHGTFVAGLIAGSGASSASHFTGTAPGAKILGLSAGDLTLSSVLAGFDHILTRGASLNVRVVNCSFSAQTVFDFNDPVNIATKMLTDRGVSVVFSAGNTGPGLHTLNPYAAAPWVVSVGATNQAGALADFSSRSAWADSFLPTVVAPGVNVVSLRASGVNLTGTLGLGGADPSRLALTELPYYTTASGTSFSAPQVAATVALMLEANPTLTPAAIQDLLQRTATPVPGRYRYEAGAGLLNAHAAVLAAKFPERKLGVWRASLERGQARYVNDPVFYFNGTVWPGSAANVGLPLPANTLQASVQIAWGGLLSTNDLNLALYDPAHVRQAAANTLNFPGLSGKRERVALTTPAGGNWRASITHAGLLATPQNYYGAVETTRVEYAALSDVGGLTPASRQEVERALRYFVMAPYGALFGPEFGVTRAELALALLARGGLPQYVAGTARYSDVTDGLTRNAVESVQQGPGGPLFPDCGATFQPDTEVNRVTAAYVLVRAAGWGAEAESRSNAEVGVTDAATIPAPLRGYVAVAMERGLVRSRNGAFEPWGCMTRVNLAHALAVLP